MPSADQVPVKSPHSRMQWHLWVVLIAGSTGSALRAVRPPNLHITPRWGAITFTLQVRLVLCNARPWPSWSLIAAWHRSNETSGRLDALPGVGPALATALVAS